MADASTMDPTRFRGMSLILIVAALFPGGCTWRVGHVEHHVGPVLFRYSEPPDGKAYVSQVLRFGLSVEGGTQARLSLGVSERITVSPRVFNPGEPGASIDSARWSTPLSLFPDSVPQRWNFSLLYLRVEGVSEPRFVSRSIYGAEVLFGVESNAVSVGAVSRTHLEPPANAFSLLRFNASHPMETLFWTWQPAPGRDLPLFSVLKEVDP